MKKWVKCLFSFLLLFALLLGSGQAKCQTAEITQLVLDVEKLATLKNILSDMYKGYQILTQGYNTVKSISQGNFSLHQAFLDGLLIVNPAIAKYQHVTDIINDESAIISEYKTAFKLFKESGQFAPYELDHLSNVYDAVFKESVNNLDELTMIVTSSKLRMSDDERLKGIDRLYTSIEGQLVFLRSFNDQTRMMIVQRIKSIEDVRSMKILHGIN